MKIYNFYKISCLLCLFFTLTACRHDEVSLTIESEQFRSSVDYIENNYALRIFSALIKKSGMYEELATRNNLTYLIPTDKALISQGFTIKEAEEMSQEQALKMVKEYLAEGLIPTKAVPNNTIDNKFKNLNDEQLYFASTEGKYYVNGVLMDKNGKDITLTNGILHVLEGKLNFTSLTLKEYLSQQTKYSLFTAGLKKFGLWEKLNGEIPYTVFALTNAQMEAAGMNKTFLDEMDAKDYYPHLFSGYIIPNHFLTQDATVLLMPVYIFMGADSVYFERNQVALFDSGDPAYQNAVMTSPSSIGLLSYKTQRPSPVASEGVVFATNPEHLNIECLDGVVHELDKVLTPPGKAKK